ncbi:hypothetical protein BJX99DRAFT_247969 [Aspergillus californicus]
MARGPSTGIKVIVIGGGFAGLGTAIECIRQGHEVEIFEQAKEFTALGDLIVLTPNGTRIVSRWDDCMLQIMKRCLWVDQMNILNTSGELLHAQPWVLQHDGYPFAMGQRSGYQEVLVRFTESLGAGIVVDGVTHHADVVIGADGIHSRCRVHVTGSEEKVQGSGYAVFRAWFNLDEDSYDLWIGQDIHAFILTCPALNMVVYAVTHKDEFNAVESYSHPGRVEDVLRSCEDWDPRFRAVVKATPANRLVDWKLLWRDPVKNWVSKGSRIAIIGDAAHPFLPTFGNGAVQALEDAATVAVLLRLAGKSNVATALRAYETLRYERVTLCQRIGFETRHRLHKTNSAKVAEDPNWMNIPQPLWQYDHDAEAYAVERWEEVVAYLGDQNENKTFRSTNIAPGHVHTNWTVEQLMELGEKLAN